jgi:hypothetical protein
MTLWTADNQHKKQLRKNSRKILEREREREITSFPAHTGLIRCPTILNQNQHTKWHTERKASPLANRYHQLKEL